MIRVFQEENWSQVESFKVIDERGRIEEGEGVGVTRDVITTFWQQLFTSASLGDREKVPCIQFVMIAKRMSGKQWRGFLYMVLKSSPTSQFHYQVLSSHLDSLVRKASAINTS